MRIYTKAGDLAFSTFTFPDGQPHFKLETYERDFSSVTIETSIKSPSDLFLVLLACDTCRSMGYTELWLDIRYLLGARMDRAIDSLQPFTLGTIARIINSCGFTKVRILDVHSDVATRLIRNSVNILPHRVVTQVLQTCGPSALVCPDAGAIPRLTAFYNIVGMRNTVYCNKKRDSETGSLSGFSLLNYNPNPNADGQEVLIVDDICDGGGTFVGLAKELRKAGAKKVYLYVTHGIFSKGLPLEGIDHIYTTNTYETAPLGTPSPNLTVIPVSMKEM